MNNKRAPRCPEGYMSRTYRTDPAIHEEIKRLAEVHKKPGGAGQLITELEIAYIKTQTGKTFKDGFKEFYREKPQTDKEYQDNLKDLEDEAAKPRAQIRRETEDAK